VGSCSAEASLAAAGREERKPAATAAAVAEEGTRRSVARSSPPMELGMARSAEARCKSSDLDPAPGRAAAVDARRRRRGRR
jgi:hypothetical protein